MGETLALADGAEAYVSRELTDPPGHSAGGEGLRLGAITG